MRHLLLALSFVSLAAPPLLAQDATDATDGTSAAKSLSDGNSTGSGSSSMKDLLNKGYEIKAAVPSGNTKLIIFMQKEKSAYACEFTNLANTRCGSVN